MSDKSTDPAPKAADRPRTPQVATGIQTSENSQLVPGMVYASPAAEEVTEVVTLPSGDKLTIQLDAKGRRVEVIDVEKGEAAPINLAEHPVPSGEYGYRPEPIPGPSIEEMSLSALPGFPEQPTAQDQIMKRAQAQADAILKAAENAVTNMDRAEARARGENVEGDVAPTLRHVSVLDPNTGVVQPDASVPLTNDEDATVPKASSTSSKDKK